jgi:hypothetical protein
MPMSLFLKSIYIKSVGVIFVVFTAIFVAGSYAQKDEVINKIILDNSNQQKILNEDIVLRDSILANYNKIEGFDSISKRIFEKAKDSTSTNRIFRNFMLMNLVDTPNIGTVFMQISNLSWADIGLLEYDSLRITIKIEKDRLLNILKDSQGSEEDRKLIKFGNYLTNEIKYKLRPRFDLLAMLLLVSILLPVVFFYIIIRSKKKNEKVIDIKQIEDQIKIIESLPTTDTSKKKEEVEALYTMLKELYPPDEKITTLTLLEADYEVFRDKSREMHERSSSFLVFSFAISIGGIIIFYFLLPQYNLNLKFTEYLGLTLRPILILSFFQTLAFYLLKQYKGSMEDYKFFYLEARNRKRFMLSYMILRSSEAEQTIARDILNDFVKQPSSKEDKDETGESVISQLVKLLEVAKDKNKQLDD